VTGNYAAPVQDRSRQKEDKPSHQAAERVKDSLHSDNADRILQAGKIRVGYAQRANARHKSTQGSDD
jgi:hypothetical protein